jgi:hypothetical protein
MLTQCTNAENSIENAFQRALSTTHQGTLIPTFLSPNLLLWPLRHEDLHAAGIGPADHAWDGGNSLLTVKDGFLEKSGVGSIPCLVPNDVARILVTKTNIVGEDGHLVPECAVNLRFEHVVQVGKRAGPGVVWLWPVGLKENATPLDRMEMHSLFERYQSSQFKPSLVVCVENFSRTNLDFLFIHPRAPHDPRNSVKRMERYHLSNTSSLGLLHLVPDPEVDQMDLLPIYVPDASSHDLQNVMETSTADWLQDFRDECGLDELDKLKFRLRYTFEVLGTPVKLPQTDNVHFTSRGSEAPEIHLCLSYTPQQLPIYDFVHQLATQPKVPFSTCDNVVLSVKYGPGCGGGDLDFVRRQIIVALSWLTPNSEWKNMSSWSLATDRVHAFVQDLAHEGGTVTGKHKYSYLPADNPYMPQEEKYRDLDTVEKLWDLLVTSHDLLDMAETVETVLHKTAGSSSQESLLDPVTTASFGVSPKPTRGNPTLLARLFKEVIRLKSQNVVYSERQKITKRIRRWSERLLPAMDPLASVDANKDGPGVYMAEAAVWKLGRDVKTWLHHLTDGQGNLGQGAQLLDPTRLEALLPGGSKWHSLEEQALEAEEEELLHTLQCEPAPGDRRKTVVPGEEETTKATMSRLKVISRQLRRCARLRCLRNLRDLDRLLAVLELWTLLDKNCIGLPKFVSLDLVGNYLDQVLSAGQSDLHVDQAHRQSILQEEDEELEVVRDTPLVQGILSRVCSLDRGIAWYLVTLPRLAGGVAKFVDGVSSKYVF